MKNKKKQFAAILLAASMLFINTNTSLYAKEEPKAKPEAAQETKTNRQPATTISAPTPVSYTHLIYLLPVNKNCFMHR